MGGEQCPSGCGPRQARADKGVCRRVGADELALRVQGERVDGQEVEGVLQLGLQGQPLQMLLPKLLGDRQGRPSRLDANAAVAVDGADQALEAERRGTSSYRLAPSATAMEPAYHMATGERARTRMTASA